MAQEQGQADAAANGSSAGRREHLLAARNAVVAASKNQISARLESRQLAAQERRQQRDTELKKKMNQLRLEQERKQELVTRRQNEKNTRANTSTTPKALDHSDGHQPIIKQKDNPIKPQPAQLSSRIQNVVNRLAIPKRSPAQLSCEPSKGAVRSPTATQVARAAASKAERDARHAANQMGDPHQVRNKRVQAMTNVKRSGDAAVRIPQPTKVDADKSANGKGATNLMTRSTTESQMNNSGGRQTRMSSEHVETANGNALFPLTLNGDEQLTAAVVECGTEPDNFVEYQRKLEENRRIARERLEDERRRLEQEQSAREEEEKRAELELIRLQEDAKEAESARMLAAIADQQRIAQEKADQERIEQEQKAEQERSRTEESHRMQEQRQRRLREEETRREARKKTVENILNSIRLHDDSRMESPSQRALPTLDVSGSESINGLLQGDIISPATSEMVKSYLSRSCCVGLNTSDYDFDTATPAKIEESYEACTTNSANEGDDIELEADVDVTPSTEGDTPVVTNDHSPSDQAVSDSSVRSLGSSHGSSDTEVVIEKAENVENMSESESSALNSEVETKFNDEKLTDIKCPADEDANNENMIVPAHQAEHAEDDSAREILNLPSSESADYTDSSGAENTTEAFILHLSTSEHPSESSEGENIAEVPVLMENHEIVDNEDKSPEDAATMENEAASFKPEPTFKEEDKFFNCHSPEDEPKHDSTVEDGLVRGVDATSEHAADKTEIARDDEQVSREEVVANDAPFADEQMENSTYLTCDTLMLADCGDATVYELDTSCGGKDEAVLSNENNGLMTTESALTCYEVISDFEKTAQVLLTPSSDACSNEASEEVMCESTESTNDVSESHYDKSTSDHLSETSTGLMNGSSKDLSSVSEDETKIILDDHITCAMVDGDSTSDDQESTFETTYSLTVNVDKSGEATDCSSNYAPANRSCSSEISSNHVDSVDHVCTENNSSAKLEDASPLDKPNNTVGTSYKASEEQVEEAKDGDSTECCPLVEEDKGSQKQS